MSTNLYDPDTPRVVAAAIVVDGVVYSLPRPARHPHVIWHMRMDRGVIGPQGAWVQGFVLSDGRFASRKEAAAVAIRAGQIEELKWPPNLYSEDLW